MKKARRRWHKDRPGDYRAEIPDDLPRHSRESGNPETSRDVPSRNQPRIATNASPLPYAAPVIPAKAGIQNRPTMIATRNQPRIATNASPLP